MSSLIAYNDTPSDLYPPANYARNSDLDHPRVSSVVSQCLGNYFHSYQLASLRTTFELLAIRLFLGLFWCFRVLGC